MIKRVINVAMILCLFLSAPLIGEQVEELYWVGYASRKVEPATVNGKRVATTFQLNFQGDQYTITNLHVCRIPNILKNRDRDPKLPKLTDADLIGEYLEINGRNYEILATDVFHDLCLVEGNHNIPAFDLATADSKGELVRIIGFPRGLDKTLRKGRIFGSEQGFMPWIPFPVVNYRLISALAYPGNSGSPVVNKYGNVVGVLFAGRRGIHTEALIVPLKDLKNFLYRNAY